MSKTKAPIASAEMTEPMATCLAISQFDMGVPQVPSITFVKDMLVSNKLILFHSRFHNPTVRVPLLGPLFAYARCPCRLPSRFS